MTRQKSERRVVPQARRKAGQTRAVENHGGGKATSVNEQTGQLGLRFETAECLEGLTSGAVGGAEGDRLHSATHAVPKSKRKKKQVTSTTMEQVCALLEVAFQNVASNKGAPGADRQSIEQVHVHLSEILPALEASLLDGTYMPGLIRRVLRRSREMTQVCSPEVTRGGRAP